MFVPCEQPAPAKGRVSTLFGERACLHFRDEDGPYCCRAARRHHPRGGGRGPVYTLFEGWAIRYHRLPSGTRQILDIVLPGDTVGLASVVLGRIKHSVQAITTALCVLRGRGFSDLFAGHPTLAFNILRTRVEEEQRMDIRLSLFGRSSAEQRIAYLMLETFDRLRQRAMVNAGSTCPFPLQRRDLADAAGLSRVDVARMPETVRDRRFAEIQNGTLVIFDRSRLMDLAGHIPLEGPVGRTALL